jgi:hypothetical protein
MAETWYRLPGYSLKHEMSWMLPRWGRENVPDDKDLERFSIAFGGKASAWRWDKSEDYCFSEHR